MVIIDRLLPGGVDGLAIVGKLRDLGKHTPVLIVSALTSIDERVRGLRSGGDDYISKPFAFSELLARVEALLRRARAGPAGQSVLQVADLTLDMRTLRVARGTTADPAAAARIAPARLPDAQSRARWSRAPCCSRRSGTAISIRRPTSSTCRSAACAARSTAASRPPLIHTIRGAGYLLGPASSAHYLPRA